MLTWQVLYELGPKTTFQYLTFPFRHMILLRKFIGREPNFEYDDPNKPGKSAYLSLLHPSSDLTILLLTILHLTILLLTIPTDDTWQVRS